MYIDESAKTPAPPQLNHHHLFAEKLKGHLEKQNKKIKLLNSAKQTLENRLNDEYTALLEKDTKLKELNELSGDYAQKLRDTVEEIEKRRTELMNSMADTETANKLFGVKVKLVELGQETNYITFGHANLSVNGGVMLSNTTISPWFTSPTQIVDIKQKKKGK